MRFSKRREDQPDINLIPFIDILMAVLIFLFLSTTFSRYTEMQLQLPVANAEAARDYPKEVIVSVAADGRYAVNKVLHEDRSVGGIEAALRQVQTAPESTLIISADAATPHQSVITVMEAARRVGLVKVTFATRKAADGE